MNGYTELFISSENSFNSLADKNLDDIFSSFRANKSCFGFIENGDIEPDMEAVTIAKSVNNDLYNYFINQLNYD